MLSGGLSLAQAYISSVLGYLGVWREAFLCRQYKAGDAQLATYWLLFCLIKRTRRLSCFLLPKTRLFCFCSPKEPDVVFVLHIFFSHAENDEIVCATNCNCCVATVTVVLLL